LVLLHAPTGIFEGTICTQFGIGIQGAYVYLRGTPMDTLSTDSRGKCVVTLPAGDYSIHTAFTINLAWPIYLQKDTTITITPGDTSRLIVSLQLPNTEPCAADSYGYRAYDRYDRDMPPNYDWVEINPSHGGYPGTEITFSHGDSAVFLESPFPITFYGESSDSLTVNCNGWMLPGIHHETGHDCTPIPSNTQNDPPGIVAPFWGDLSTGQDQRQFAWNDSANGRWIFEFTSQHLVRFDNRYFNWEVHLLDPAFNPTLSGDGDILFFYGAMDLLHLCTIGIESPNEQTGIQVMYMDSQDSTAWPIESGSAIRFTTGQPSDSGTVSGLVTLYPPCSQIRTAMIHIGGRVVMPDSMGTFIDHAVAAAPASAVLALPGYEASRLFGIPVSPTVPTSIAIEAWRLDPPRSLSAIREGRTVLLRWRAPESVSYHGNQAVRYQVFRDGIFVGSESADTSFIDHPTVDSGFVCYSVASHYRWGKSHPSDSVCVHIDLSVSNAATLLPHNFSLRPNFPNPFNSSTTISFEVPSLSVVRIRIFNIDGQEVTTLFTGRQSPGLHMIRWNAVDYPSGVYLIVLEADKRRAVQKVLLLR
jgi:hypothetical protein